jgi:tRNA-modifying protein YgfZ
MIVTSVPEVLETVNAALTGVALYDCSEWGRIQVSDADRLKFVHNQTTNSLNLLKPGQGCDTVVINSTGRTLDLVTAYVTEDAVLLLVSPQRRQHLLKWFDRYIFFGDKVQLTDVTATTATWRVIGPQAEARLTQFGVVLPTEPHHHVQTELAGVAVRIACGSGLALPGYTLIFEAEQVARLAEAFAGVVQLDEQAWQHLRILQGRPQPDAELTEDYNPLEAGLWQTISFNKGCYIGQETIARLNTYQGVKQQLWGIQLPQAVAPGTPILLEAVKVGVCTSCTPTATGAFALGYIKTKAGGAGLAVQVGEQPGTVVDVPFLTRQIFDDHSAT